jgi:F0F1-type ATP synthase membrane subunit b/b'
MLYNIILFILIIIIIHFLWNYLKDIFTIKKKKYINYEIDKYRQLLEEYPSALSPKEENEVQHSLLEQDLEMFLQNNI